MQKISSRIHRLQGQLTSLESAIAADASCSEVIPQLLAAKGALDATVQTYLESAMDECVAGEDSEALKRVIKMFIKHTS